jgi:hypothetical protein
MKFKIMIVSYASIGAVQSAANMGDKEVKGTNVLEDPVIVAIANEK